MKIIKTFKEFEDSLRNKNFISFLFKTDKEIYKKYVWVEVDFIEKRKSFINPKGGKIWEARFFFTEGRNPINKGNGITIRSTILKGEIIEVIKSEMKRLWFKNKEEINIEKKNLDLEEIQEKRFEYNISANLDDLLKDDEDWDLEEELTQNLLKCIPNIIKELGYTIHMNQVDIEGFPLSVNFTLKREKELKEKEKNKIIKKLDTIKVEWGNLSFELIDNISN